VGAMIALVGLTFGVLLVVTLPKLGVTREKAARLVMLACYVHIVMVFHASIDNLRYFVPVVPFMALFGVRVLRAIHGKWLFAGLLRPDIRIHYARSLEDLGPVPHDAWIFCPERISRHPGDPPGRSSEWLVHGSTPLSHRQE